jgi:hypothetical protein
MDFSKLYPLPHKEYFKKSTLKIELIIRTGLYLNILNLEDLSTKTMDPGSPGIPGRRQTGNRRLE